MLSCGCATYFMDRRDLNSHQDQDTRVLELAKESREEEESNASSAEKDACGVGHPNSSTRKSILIIDSTYPSRQIKKEQTSISKSGVPLQIIVKNGKMQNCDELETSRTVKLITNSSSEREVQELEEIAQVEEKNDEEGSKSSNDLSQRSGGSSYSMSLVELRKRNIAIGMKRREEIQNARKRHHPGALLFMSPSYNSSRHDDNFSISNFSSSSSIMKQTCHSLSRPIPDIITTEVSKDFSQKSPIKRRSTSPTETVTTASSFSSKSTRRCLEDLAERNRKIASKRKEAIEKARAAERFTRTLPSRPSKSNKSSSKMAVTSIQSPQKSRFEHLYEKGRSKNREDLVNAKEIFEWDKLSSRQQKETMVKKDLRDNNSPDDHTSRDRDSFRSKSSTSSNSRLIRLYEAGKQKNLADLHRSIEERQEKRSITVIRQQVKTNLLELNKRHLEVGKKRREAIEKARAASTCRARPLPKVPNLRTSYQSRRRIHPSDPFHTDHAIHRRFRIAVPE